MAIRNLKNKPISTSIQSDVDAFNKELSRLAKFCDFNYDAIVSKTMIDLFRRILENTPIDTGRAIANWSMGYSPIDSSEHVDFDNADQFVYKDEKGTTIWIYNNLVYIVPLEEGHSQQAPRGMVAIALSDFEQFLKNAANQLSDTVFYK